MATIKEVATLAGVSVGTVSHVLSGAANVSPVLKEKVCRAVRKLDYHPNHVARSLKTKQTKTLGMIISDITNPFFPQVVRGAEDVAFGRGYVLVTFNTDDDVARERKILSILRARRTDGVLLVVAPNTGDVSHIQAVVSAGVPIVCLDRVPRGLDGDRVSVDNRKGAEVAVRHLIEQGHKRIGIITGPSVLQTAADRLKGYKCALRQAGIKMDADLVRVGDFHVESGYRLGKDLLLTRARPTALFVSNGQMTVGLLRALHEIGLECPRDIAIVGFDDLPAADVFRPRITAVRQPAYEIGRQGAELLIQRIEGGPDKRPIKICLEPELKIRESSMGTLAKTV